MDYEGELNWVLEKWIFDVSTPPTLLIFSYFTCLRTDPQNDQNFWWERESLISRSSLQIGRWGPSIKKKLQYHDSVNLKVSTMEFKISSFDKFGQKIKSVPNLLVMQFLLLIKCRQILLNLQQFAVFCGERKGKLGNLNNLRILFSPVIQSHQIQLLLRRFNFARWLAVCKSNNKYKRWR